MGLSLFSKCSVEPACRVERVVEQLDLSTYWVLDTAKVGQCTIVKVKYRNATNFEGVKILVYLGDLPAKLDPHFCDNHKSPIARFEPTERGWFLANHLASTVNFTV